ncbi:HesA/MoeB/ThiF family protein [Alteromonas sp. CYL-A6]|uniref:HesA/MoeB/ThiF family protein n=1 Tax=Alteromonas nitratireducens TaxID=3390813 RepID=UPI0034B830DF
MTSSLPYEQLLRFNRQIVLPQVDIDGQERLSAARVLVIGLGGLGNAASQSLAGGGVGHLTLVDHDVVETTNLPRQPLFTDTDCGRLKVDAAKERLAALNPACRITAVDQAVSPSTLPALLAGHDVVLDCTDNVAARDAINAACVQHARPLVSAAAIRFEGQVFVVRQAPPCYACVRALFSAPRLSCTEAGIFSPVAAITGTYQALLALQLLLGLPVPEGCLLCFDALTHQWQPFTVPPHPACPVCRSL